MQAYDYFNQSVQKLEKIYSKEEASQILYWVYEDVLLIKKAHLHLFNKELGMAEEMKLDSILNRLLSCEPLQYILGYAYFRNLRIKVSPAVLIPRPETEELVEWVIEEVKNHFDSTQPISILDIGTGSGCIAISLEQEIKNSKISAMDISKQALSVARENALSYQSNISFREASILSGEDKSWVVDQNFDIMVSNPPYIKEAEKISMHANVIDFEPHLAYLVPDENPLLFSHNILETFNESKNTKMLFFEISEFQELALEDLCKKYLMPYKFRKDIQGKTRMLQIMKADNFPLM